ncbi:MAG: DNA-directed RNA polymerase subunit omega [Clostridia bacterium]|nr:DNA-directed RNA polymerase subunit omega [Clostridia bacterium]
MMIYPPIDELAQKADGRYELVTALAKRAREIIADEQPLTQKPVTQAIEELNEGKIIIHSAKDEQ